MSGSNTLSLSDQIFRQLNSAYRSGYQIGDQSFLQTLANLISGQGAYPFQSGTASEPSVAVGDPGTGFYEVLAGTISAGIGASVAGFEQFRINAAVSAVNRVEVTGAATGAAVQLAAAGSDTNVQLNITSKGTSNISIRTGSNQQVLIANTTSSVNFWQLTGSTSTNNIVVSAQGTAVNLGMAYLAKGTGAHEFCTQGASARIQFRVADTAGTVVNYVQAGGNITAQAPIVSAQGTDANINLRLEPKGTGLVDIGRNLTNYMSIAGAATTFMPVLSSQGSDTNIDLRLLPKGTGQLDVSGTAATVATSAPAFSATHRVQIKVNGTSFWLPVSNTGW